MSSVGVLIKKNLSVLWEKKSKCPKKNFQSVEGRKKNVSVGFRVFGRKKMEIERKVPGKNQSVFLSKLK